MLSMLALPTSASAVLATTVMLVPAILVSVVAELLVLASAVFLPEARIAILFKLFFGDELVAVRFFAPWRFARGSHKPHHLQMHRSQQGLEAPPSAESVFQAIEL